MSFFSCRTVDHVQLLPSLSENFLEGGLAVPVFSSILYGRTVGAHRWFSSLLVSLEAATVDSLEALSCLVYRGCKAPYPLTASMQSTRAWEVTWWAESNNAPNVLPHVPLWKNPHLSHFCTYPDPILWTKLGVKKIGDVVGNGVLIQFDALKSQYQLPNSHLFWYLQFHHTFYAQLDLLGLPFRLGFWRIYYMMSLYLKPYQPHTLV